QTVGQTAHDSRLLDRAVRADQHAGNDDALNLVVARFFGVDRLRAVERHRLLVYDRGHGIAVAAAHVIAMSWPCAGAIAAADAAARTRADAVGHTSRVTTRN